MIAEKNKFFVFSIWHKILKILIKYPVIFIPFLFMALFDALVLTALVFAPTSSIFSIMQPVLNGISGIEMLKYPFNVVLLPGLFACVRDSAGFLFGIFFTGLSVSFIRQAAQDREPGLWFGIKKTLKKYSGLLIIWFINMGIYSFFLGVVGIFGTYLHNNMFIFGIKFMLIISVQMVLSFAISVVIVENKKVIGALMRSIKLFKRYPLTAFLFVTIPGIIMMSVWSTAFRLPLISGCINPKIILYILVLNIVMITIIDFFITSSATVLLLLHRKIERRN